MFNKVSIIGVGLMGASFALALKENALCATICGYGRTEDNLRHAKERGIIDDYNLNLKEACKDSDLILLATPVGIFKEIVQNMKGYLKKGAIVTDVGSVKGKLVYDLELLMPSGVYFIGSHPIAGSDKSGIADARGDLFKNARCIITITDNTDESAKEKIICLWQAIGAKTELMDPYRHDEIYAAVSHFPHIIAYAIVNTVGDIDSKYISYAGKGFKDATRIALSSPELWRDISIANKENLIRLIGIFRKNVEKIEGLLLSEDSKRLEDEFLRAQILRKQLK